MVTNMPAQIAFMHMGKTAGTSFHNLLVDAFKERKSFNGSPEQYDAQSPAQLAMFGILLGHFSFHHSFKFRPDRYLITFLRDPVERVLSNYFFLKSWKGEINSTNEKMVKAARKLSLCGFLECQEPQVEMVTKNHQAYFLGADWRSPRIQDDSQVLDRAMNNLKDINFIGFTENYEECVNALMQELGLPTVNKFKSENVTPSKMSKDQIRKEDIELIKKLNYMDIEIYNQARQNA